MGTTPILAIPYVEPTDTLVTYPAAMKAQSERIEAVIPKLASGIVNITTNTTAGATAAVTFAVGAFSAIPKVIVSRATGGAAKAVPYASGISAAGFTAGIYNGDGTVNSAGLVVPLHWLAIP